MKKIGVIGVPGGWSSESLAKALEKKTGTRLIIDMAEVSLDTVSGRVMYRDLDISALDALIVKKAGPAYSRKLLDRMEILRYLHGRGLPIFSRPESILRVLNRLNCTLGLLSGGIPMPPTVITESVDQALAAVEDYGRAVLKPLLSSKARGMKVVKAGPEAGRCVLEFKKENPILYVQKMLNLPGKDLGVAFMGGEYLATYAREGCEGSWNTTTHSGGRYAPHKPSREVIDLAGRAQDLFDLDFTCVDVALAPDGPVVFEVSAFGGFRGLLQACNLDAADLYSSYVLKKLGQNA